MTYPRDVDIETPEEDAAEQRTDAFGDDEEGVPSRSELDIETPEADAQEQSEIVRDDDEYR